MAKTAAELVQIPYSGDARVDALLDRAVPWNFFPDGRNVLYYTFDVSTGSEAAGNTSGPVVAFNTVQQQAARAIVEYASTLTGIQFVEVATSAQADVHFAATDLPSASMAGLATSTFEYAADASGKLTSLQADAVVYLDNAEHNYTLNPEWGTWGYEVLLHEFGHVLGMGHPFSGPHPLDHEHDNTDNTVMSYTNHGTPQTSFQLYDQLALQWLYGGDGLGGEWGVNGSKGPTLDGMGSGDQPQTGGGSSGAAAGSPSNDTFTSTPDNDQIDGAGGVDTMVFQGRRADYTLTQEGAVLKVGDLVAGRDGIDSLLNVERLRFSDGSLAMDLDGAAGTAVRLIGTLAGAQAVGQASLVGVVLSVIDSGVQGEALADLALQAVLGSNATNAQVANLVHTNLYPGSTDTALAAQWTGYLDNGTYSRADLVMQAAASDANIANVGLVGLAETGVAYV